jgi:hypothetical protein
MYDKKAVQRLEEKLDYETWILSFLSEEMEPFPIGRYLGGDQRRLPSSLVFEFRTGLDIGLSLFRSFVCCVNYNIDINVHCLDHKTFI